MNRGPRIAGQLEGSDGWSERRGGREDVAPGAERRGGRCRGRAAGARPRCGPRAGQSRRRARPRGARARAACGPRPRLACDLRRGAPTAAGLGGAARGRGRAGRARAGPAGGGLRRVSGPDPGRHPDEPGRDGPARGTRPRSRGDPALRPGRGRRAAPRRQHHGPPGASRRPDRGRPVRRMGPRRRHPGADPRAVPALCRGAGASLRPGVARARPADPGRGGRCGRRARRVRPDGPGGARRPWPRQGRDVRGHRGARARLHRRRLARHPLGDRGRADRPGRHRRPEGPLPPGDRVGQNPADRGLHRAQHRLRSRLAADPRGPGRRPVSGPWRQDLDHPRRPRGPHDHPLPHRSRPARLPRPLDPFGREAARHRGRAVPGRRPRRRGDPGARLPRHEGVHARLRRLCRAQRMACSAASRARASSS